MNLSTFVNILEGLRSSTKDDEVKSQILFINFYFKVIEYITNEDYITTSLELSYHQDPKKPLNLNPQSLLKKGSLLHSGVQNMYVNHLANLISKKKFKEEELKLIRGLELDLFKYKFKDFFQNLWETSEIYKENDLYFCLSQTEVFLIKDHSRSHSD